MCFTMVWLTRSILQYVSLINTIAICGKYYFDISKTPFYTIFLHIFICSFNKWLNYIFIHHLILHTSIEHSLYILFDQKTCVSLKCNFIIADYQVKTLQLPSVHSIVCVYKKSHDHLKPIVPSQLSNTTKLLLFHFFQNLDIKLKNTFQTHVFLNCIHLSTNL